MWLAVKCSRLLFPEVTKRKISERIWKNYMKFSVSNKLYFCSLTLMLWKKGSWSWLIICWLLEWFLLCLMMTARNKYVIKWEMKLKRKEWERPKTTCNIIKLKNIFRWNYFLEKVKDNLHIILAMSPAGDSLRIRCRNFPGMVSNTSIDWFFNWPEEALESVANYFLGEVDLPLDVKPKIISHIVMTHISISKFSEDFERQMKRKNFSTPKNYLDFL